MAISCINCGFPQAVLSGDGLACGKCGHRWTFQQEQDNAAYIQNVLRRQPMKPPVASEQVKAEDEKPNALTPEEKPKTRRKKG